jgi:hypothetical protein
MSGILFHCPNDPLEWILFDLQGDLVMKSQVIIDNSLFNNNNLGYIISVNNNIASVRIGNNILEGKLEKLKKPLILCKKTKDLNENEIKWLNENNKQFSFVNLAAEPKLHLLAIVKQKFAFSTRPKAVVSQV